MRYKKISKVSNQCVNLESFIDELSNLKQSVLSAVEPHITITISSNVHQDISLDLDEKVYIETSLNKVNENCKFMLNEKTIILKDLIKYE